jgi:Cu/Ag efflux protein CusF
MKNHIQTVFISMAMVIAIGCSKRQEEVKPESQPPAQTQPATQTIPGKSGKGMGVVEKISSNGKFITLDHNDIPNIMDAMVMEYPVQSPELLKGIKIHDSVGFTLTKTPESQYMVTQINKK